MKFKSLKISKNEYNLHRFPAQGYRYHCNYSKSRLAGGGSHGAHLTKRFKV